MGGSSAKHIGPRAALQRAGLAPAPGLSRREALALLLAGLPPLLAPSRADAFGAASKVRLAQLSYRGGNPVPRPTALARLAWELDKRTSVDVALSPVTIGAADRRLFHHPLLFLGGDQAFALPRRAELDRLRRFLVFGGTLVVDSAEARPGGPFDRSARQLAAALFPRHPLKKIGKDHVLHKSFYLLDRAVGRVATVPYLEGVAHDGRMVLVYSQNDLAGAWARDNLGHWEHNVYPGGARQREAAFRWGINIVMYALCVDYKADQVHIPFILKKRRRWRIR